MSTISVSKKLRKKGIVKAKYWESITACDSGDTGLVIFVDQKAENQLQWRPKEKNWELYEEQDML